ncbi:hypothetical protein L6164_027519 [Bauhinia variegata]|uniref:Uncharacterized protein n=1 Tax=Bauhinia variegata TaxID=167791 RepID=A0ACB9LTS6_BAUVA|nr:hypothetical protein L6164_027519 [Bauhinia variegata]
MSHSQYHVRSISLPSRLHPTSLNVVTELNKLKTWEGSDSDTASSVQAEMIKSGLAGLAELYNCVQELIHCPQTQQALLRGSHNQGKYVENLLDMSVGLLDVCGSARELLLLMKEHIQDLQSALRRKGLDSSIKDHIHAYVCFRKKAKREISNGLKSLKTMENSYKSFPLLDLDYHLLMVVNLLRELCTITISFFRKLLFFMHVTLLKKHTRRWSLFSGSDRGTRIVGGIDIALCFFHGRVRKTNAKADIQIVKRRLEEIEGSIKELEAGVDCIFKCLIQHRVSLLNLFTH